MMEFETVFRHKTILVVDDEPTLREPLMVEFESFGAKVLEAPNGRIAFDLVTKHNVDAIISDVRMPGGDGIELLKRVKELDSHFPVVMLITGFADLSHEEAYHLGADAILAKPFDLDEIDRAAARILTPRHVRWEPGPGSEPAQLSSTSRTQHHIDERFSEIMEAQKAGHIALGRGGLFVKIPNAQPAKGRLATINIQFDSGDVLVIEGSGVIRWARTEVNGPLPAGWGIEFATLTEASRNAILEITDRLNPKPFIPKGPTSN